MTLHLHTTQEKLTLIERFIEARRHLKADPAISYELELLKSVAKDLRGRMDGAPSVAIREIEMRVLKVGRARVRNHYNIESLIDLAEQVVARWPTIKQALERFGVETESSTNGQDERQLT